MTSWLLVAVALFAQHALAALVPGLGAPPDAWQTYVDRTFKPSTSKPAPAAGPPKPSAPAHPKANGTPTVAIVIICIVLFIILVCSVLWWQRKRHHGGNMQQMMGGGAMGGGAGMGMGAPPPMDMGMGGAPPAF